MASPGVTGSSSRLWQIVALPKQIAFRLVGSPLTAIVNAVLRRSSNETPDAVYVEDGDGDGIVHVGCSALTHLDAATNPYPDGPPTSVDLDDEKGDFVMVIKVPKTFRSDVSRIGQPDRFLIGACVFNVPVTTDEAQDAMVSQVCRYVGNVAKVEKLLQMWSFRTKAALINQVTEEFKRTYLNLVPSFGRDSFQSVSTTLLDADSVRCDITGRIDHAFEEPDMNLKKMNIQYTASVSVRFM